MLFVYIFMYNNSDLIHNISIAYITNNSVYPCVTCVLRRNVYILYHYFVNICKLVLTKQKKPKKAFVLTLWKQIPIIF